MLSKNLFVIFCGIIFIICISLHIEDVYAVVSGGPSVQMRDDVVLLTLFDFEYYVILADVLNPFVITDSII